jgi:hypothetical protein
LELVLTDDVSVGRLCSPFCPALLLDGEGFIEPNVSAGEGGPGLIVRMDLSDRETVEEDSSS